MIPLATKLFGSQLSTGRQTRPQPYGARRIAVRSLRVALAIKILFPPPPAALAALPCARLFLDLLAPDLRPLRRVSFPLSPISRLFVVFQYSTRYCAGN